ncbi:MAG: hypothetical protein OIF38_09085, partial [Cellvibrionaceae bacterium]|nr:hypothetical protein [Cellvibrionaceae bacterium]
MTSPEELKLKLCQLFPSFAGEFESNEECSLYSVFQAFSPVAYKLISSASVMELRRLCNILNEGVAEGGVLENAISTCFLEHASQVGVRNLVKPYLS